MKVWTFLFALMALVSYAIWFAGRHPLVPSEPAWMHIPAPPVVRFAFVKGQRYEVGKTEVCVEDSGCYLVVRIDGSTLTLDRSIPLTGTATIDVPVDHSETK